MGLPYARRERPAACHYPIQYIECRKQIRYCPCPNPRGEIQTLPNIISFRIIPHLKSVITCVRYIIQGRNRNSKKQSIIEMTIL